MMPQRLEVEREQARAYREKFNIGQRFDSYGGGGNMSSVSSQGYGGYGQKQDQPGVIGAAAQGIGSIATGVASGVGSAITTGISYLGWKGNQQGPPSGTKMTGFGSDSYSGGSGAYQGGSSIYNPPGGNNPYQSIGEGGAESIKSSISAQPKWGAPKTATPSDDKKTKPARKESSSSSSSEDEAPPSKSKDTKSAPAKAEVNLLELDAAPPVSNPPTVFDFMTGAPKPKETDLFDFLSAPSQPAPQ